MLPPLEFPPDEPDAINGLPDELLATILKIAADFPPFALHRTLPFPVVASRVSRRWHTIALGSPELWTNIKIFDNARSLHWAAVFAERSQPYPLDISINLQPYGPNIKNPSDWGYNVQDKVLAIVGPLIGRWRAFAFRGWARQLESIRQFILQSPVVPSRLESLHVDQLRLNDGEGHDDEPPVPLGDFFRGGHLRSLRVTYLYPCMLASFSALQSLDISGLSTALLKSPEFRHLLSPSSTLTTLVLRDVYSSHTRMPKETPVIAATIRTLSIRFHRVFASWNRHVGEAFDFVTSKFSFPNLESLEMVDGFSGHDKEDDFIKVPEPWETPLFPRLRTLRLETLGFSRKGLALIQSVSPDISHLELIHITNNPELLLERSSLQAWPALRTVTFEDTKRHADEFIAVFLAARVYVGHKPLEELTVPPWDSLALCLPWPKTTFQYDGPSSGLTESAFGCGTSSYLDYGSLRGMDFETLWDCREEYDDSEFWGPPGWEWDDDTDSARLEAEIEECLRMEGALVREKSMLRASRRHKPKQVTQERKPKARRRHYDLREDFCIAR
ncbi:hypothetical protein C8R46DRAFT_1362237 [Mycena filopes]|nr:hypothetical protein C8R46DRAFT_1362237 [Mycena filopes]